MPKQKSITDTVSEFRDSIIALSTGAATPEKIKTFVEASEQFNAAIGKRTRHLEAANDNAPYPGIISSGDFVRGFVPPDYHLDGVFQSRFFYSLTGVTGTGKTAVLLLLAAATAMGLPIAGREVKQGRVVYLAGENPDDVQMRWIAYGHSLGFDPDSVDVHFLNGATNIAVSLEALRKDVEKLGGADLIIVDTSAAFFHGADENSNTDAGKHARTLRTLTTLPGEPAVLVATHPTKNAASDALLPRGGGAFVAEVDGNLTLSKADGLVRLHWQGKHRGCDFDPLMFKLETVTAPSLIDSKGRQVPTVIATDMSDVEVGAAKRQAFTDQDAILIALEGNPGMSIRDLAESLRWTNKDGEPDRRRAQTATDKLRAQRLMKFEARKWKFTLAGLEALADAKARRHAEEQAASFTARMREKMG